MNEKKLTEAAIQAVRNKADIYTVVSDYCKLKRTGTEYTCPCPIHNGRSWGSFKVSPAKNFAKCFSCGWQGDPIEFVKAMEKTDFAGAVRKLGAKYGIPIDDMPADWKPERRPEPPKLPTLILPETLVEARSDISRDTLCQWLRQGIAWNAEQSERLEQNLRDYRIGHSARAGFTIYWQIDETGGVRTGKMMLYKADGHRDKRKGAYTFDWIHSTLCRRKRDTDPWPHPDLYDPDRQEVRQTLFGMHLLDRYPGAEIRIVESEKTALIMATAYGNNRRWLWMACGGKENISRERLEPIIRQRRQVVLFPDRDSIAKWKEKAHALRYEFTHVRTEEVLKQWRPEDGEKADVADITVRIINRMANPTRFTNADEVKAAIPEAAELIDKLNLTPTQTEYDKPNPKTE